MNGKPQTRFLGIWLRWLIFPRYVVAVIHSFAEPRELYAETFGLSTFSQTLIFVGFHKLLIPKKNKKVTTL